VLGAVIVIVHVYGGELGTVGHAERVVDLYECIGGKKSLEKLDFTWFEGPLEKSDKSRA